MGPPGTKSSLQLYLGGGPTGPSHGTPVAGRKASRRRGAPAPEPKLGSRGKQGPLRDGRSTHLPHVGREAPLRAPTPPGRRGPSPPALGRLRPPAAAE